jgi:hypothetical protein
MPSMVESRMRQMLVRRVETCGDGNGFPFVVRKNISNALFLRFTTDLSFATVGRSFSK